MLFGQEFMPLEDLLFFGAASGGKLSELTASGNPCVFETNVARPLKRLALSLLPRQSGTGDPSPSNIRPLIPWGEVGTWHGGKNLLDEQGEIYNRTIGEESWTISTSAKTLVFKGKPNTQYTITIFNNDSTIFRCCTIDADPETVTAERYPISNYNSPSSRKATITTGNTDVWIVVQASGAYITSRNAQLMIVAGPDFPTEYTPYTPVLAYPVNLRKNLLPPLTSETKNGVTISVANDGTVTVNGTPTEDTYFDCNFSYFVAEGEKMNLCGFNPVPSSSSRTTVFLITDKGNPQVNLHTANEILTGLASADTTITKYRLRLPKDVAFTNFVVKPLFYIGENTPTEYQPYLPPVYGCEIDLTTGEVWGTWASFSAKWKDGTQPSVRGSNTRKMFSLPNIFVQASGRVTAYCNVAKWEWDYEIDNIHFYLNRGTSYIFLPNDTDGETDIFIVGKLETPILLATLTAQQVNALVGVNTVWSDADGIELTYLKKG